MRQRKLVQLFLVSHVILGVHVYQDMRQRKLVQLFLVSQVILGVHVYQWNPVSKVWMINLQNIINIPESEIKGFGFCTVLS
jgi:hypothetical protein